MTPARLAFWVSMTLACCGCASAPVSYYSLMPPSSSNAETSSTCCVIEIRNVRIPSQVDRPELVIRRSDEQFDVLSNDLWIAPLRDELRGALLEDIREKLVREQSGREAKAQKFLVFVDITRFESDPAKYALIEAGWRVERAGPKSSAPVCKTRVQVPISGGLSGVVQGYRRALSTVASSIATKLLDAEQNGSLECPTPQAG